MIQWPSFQTGSNPSVARHMNGVKNKLLRIYPEHPYLYSARRAGTLLFQSLQNEHRCNIILPGFICPKLSAMAQKTGKKVIHIDVHPDTMHMQTELLERYLASHSASESCLLIDHTFGYVYSEIQLIRRQYPELLIIEDCVRTLGGLHNKEPAGTTGDWIILSMYKTVRGNEHGGLLLSRTPLSCKEEGYIAHPSLREYVSKIRLLRTIHDKLKSKQAPLGSESTIREDIHFTEEPGLPSTLIINRFLQELKALKTKTRQRYNAWNDLYETLSQNKNLQFIQIQKQTTPSYHFLSFFVPEISDLHSFLQRLNQAGFFLFNAWPDPPNYFRCFQESFIYGDKNTLYLARNIIHIPVADFLSKKKRKKFLQYFEYLLIELRENET